MVRPIITQEDVKAARDKGILEVPEDAVVTQAARELAQRSGVSIKQAGAPAALPAHLPRGLPGESATADSNRCLLTAVGRNRPFILAEITKRVADLGGSVHDISQKIVGDYFSLIFVVDLAGAESFGAFKAEVEVLSAQGDYKVVVQHERIFKAMHRL